MCCVYIRCTVYLHTVNSLMLLHEKVLAWKLSVCPERIWPMNFLTLSEGLETFRACVVTMALGASNLIRANYPLTRNSISIFTHVHQAICSLWIFHLSFLSFSPFFCMGNINRRIFIYIIRELIYTYMPQIWYSTWFKSFKAQGASF